MVGTRNIAARIRPTRPSLCSVIRSRFQAPVGAPTLLRSHIADLAMLIPKKYGGTWSRLVHLQLLLLTS
jgi:hypothetical protein